MSPKSIPPTPVFRRLAFLFAIAPLVVSSVTNLAGCKAEPDDANTAPKKVAAPAPTPATPPPKCEATADPLLSEIYRDDFNRTELGPDWNSTSYGAYFVKNNHLCFAKPRNHPLWLKRKLPPNVRVEFQATPLTAKADVKAEIFGDGCSFDTAGRDYTATSYVAVLGAHDNSEHWLAKQYEHGPDAKKTPLTLEAPSIASGKLTMQKRYNVELSRTNGKEVRLLVDGVVVHEFDDSAPLVGEGHDHFAFNGWESGVCFDKLVITPLP